MTTTYEKFDRAFRNVGAYTVSDASGKPVGRIAFKYGEGGQVDCYAQVWGAAMVHGFARGGGYDKSTAAAQEACAKLACGRGDAAEGAPHGQHVEAWKAAMGGVGGERWTNRLEAAGYTVQHVFG